MKFVGKLEYYLMRLALWIAGPVIAWFALPIEGEFWATMMPAVYHNRAYNLCFALDLVGEMLIYFAARIQQTAAKNSKQGRMARVIYGFAAIPALASWGIAYQQLRVLGFVVVVAALNALIQPAIQAGIGFTQAVLEGKFEEKQEKEPTKVHEPEPKHVESTPAPVELTPRQKEMLKIWAEDPSLNQSKVGAMLSEPMSRGTVANEWAILKREGVAKRNGNGVEILCSL